MTALVTVAPQSVTLEPHCARATEVLRDFAVTKVGMTPGDTYPGGVLYRLAWDAPAAFEFPRPMIQDAVDVEHLWPDLATEVWHHVSGATMALNPLCLCIVPAAHRDALIALSRRIQERM